ncbi:MAG: tetratricopeptide repeat protein, partial [Bacteroidia bacterium]|nr:tetratricopeptide repeat protein [Bacteroidia bacterium]
MKKNLPPLFLCTTLAVVFFLSCKHNDKQAEKEEGITNVSTSKELSELNEKIMADSGNAELFYSRAKYFMSIHDYTAALTDMSQTMHRDSTKPVYYITLSDLYLYTNQTGKSKIALEKCISIDPKNTDAMLKLAELYFYVKKYQESINYLNDALKIDNYISKAYFLKGMNFKELGDTAKSISAMITATEQDPDYFSAYMELGLLYAAQKNKLAVDYYNNALRINSGSTQALYNKAKFFQDIKEWNSSDSIYGILLKMDPKYKNAYYNLGAIALVNKQYEKAIKNFSNAINTDPKYTEAYYARGTAYLQLKDKTKAKADYQMAIQIDPEYLPAKN